MWWSAPRRSSGGTSFQQTSTCLKQREAKRHIGGGSIGLGMSPLKMIRSRRSPEIVGIAERSAFVYGCRGLSKISSAGASSTSFPRYITAIRSGEVPDDREVVRDEQVRQPEVLLQVVQEVEHLRLHGHVERRHGLVEDEKLRIDGERSGDPDALALASRELVRVAARERGASPTRSSSSPILRSRSARPSALAVPRRRCCRRDIRGSSDEYGSWKTICTRRRSSRSARRSACVNVDAADPDRSARQRHAGASARRAERRLAGARLADEAERLAAADRQRYVVDAPRGGSWRGRAARVLTGKTLVRCSISTSGSVAAVIRVELLGVPAAERMARRADRPRASDARASQRSVTCGQRAAKGHRPGRTRRSGGRPGNHVQARHARASAST